VLLLVGENLARLMDRDNRIVAPVFGDCGTATLLEYREQASPAYFALGTDGSGAEALMIPAGLARLPLPDTAAEYEALCMPLCDPQDTPWRLIRTYMDGGAVFDFTLNVVPDHLRSLLAYAGKQTEDIDWLVLHQANKQIMQAIAEKSGFDPAKAPWNTFCEYGNQAGASIPSAICHMLAEELADGPKTLLLAGYGIGLSWASVVLTMDAPWCSGIRDYVIPPDHQSPEQFYAHWVEKITGRKA
jgi:3-oxoacyl-[acyl-carrier-protein] synthase-3